MERPSSEDPEILTIALNHAWAWYEASFGHRLQMLNFMFLVIAANVAGYIAALQAKLEPVAGGIALVAAVMTGVFAQLAPRTRQRVDIAAAPLSLLQDRLATMIELDELRMVARAKAPQPRRRTTVWIGSVMYVVLILAFLTASGYAFFG